MLIVVGALWHTYLTTSTLRVKFVSLQDTVGNGSPGHSGGDFSSAQFRAPQGVCWLGEHVLFVADTENHLIRKVCTVVLLQKVLLIYI